MKATVHLWFWMLAEELLEIEAGHDDQPRPRVQGGVEQHRHAVDVEERQDRDHHVVGLHVLHRPDLRDVGDQVAVRQHHALGVAGGAGAVGEHCQVRRRGEAHFRCGTGRFEQVGGVRMAALRLPGAVEHHKGGVVQSDRGRRLLGLRPAAV